jgi:hypothetical protein
MNGLSACSTALADTWCGRPGSKGPRRAVGGRTDEQGAGTRIAPCSVATGMPSRCGYQYRERRVAPSRSVSWADHAGPARRPGLPTAAPPAVPVDPGPNPARNRETGTQAGTLTGTGNRTVGAVPDRKDGSRWPIPPRPVPVRCARSTHWTPNGPCCAGATGDHPSSLAGRNSSRRWPPWPGSTT